MFLYIGCKQDKPVITPPKTYSDLTKQWSFIYPICEGFDTTSHELIPLFSNSRKTSMTFSLINKNNSNLEYQVEYFYSESSSGNSGTYYKYRKAAIDLKTDSITFPIFESLYGDSIGSFTGKYNNKKNTLEGYFDTWYNMYCHCRFAGVNAPYRHKVTTL